MIEIGVDTLHRSLAGETILVNLESGECFRLDTTGNRIWELIVELGSRDEIAVALADQFDAEPERIVADLDAFLEALEAKGLITNE